MPCSELHFQSINQPAQLACAPTLNCSVDNPAFMVKPSEKVPAKKTTTVGITYRPSDPSKPRTGKLTITCPSQAGVAWVYYLQA
jgi:hypothetical protein